MAITALPTVPTRADPANFADRSDALLTALPTFVTEANALQTDVNAKQSTASTAAATATTQAGLAATNGAAQVTLATAQASNALTRANQAAASALTAVNAPGTSAASTTSLTMGVGSKSLTIQTAKSFVVGMFVIIARTSAPTIIYMAGVIAAYNSGTGLLSVTTTTSTGAGTYTDWTISISGIIGANGASPQDFTNYSMGII
jgi:hypothetical protein